MIRSRGEYRVHRLDTLWKFFECWILYFVFFGRINAVKSLQTISVALGVERTRNELLPYILDLMDDDEEILDLKHRISDDENLTLKVLNGIYENGEVELDGF